MRFLSFSHHRLSRMGGSCSGSHTGGGTETQAVSVSWATYPTWHVAAQDVTGRESWEISWDIFISQFGNGLHHFRSCFMGQNSGIWPLTHPQGRLGKMDASRVPKGKWWEIHSTVSATALKWNQLYLFYCYIIIIIIILLLLLL